MLFIINPHSIIDLITNSSTELFVMRGSEKKHVEEIIKAIYPDYLNEYKPLLDVKDFSIEELDSFLAWCLGRNSCCWDSSVIYNDPNDYVVLSGFKFDEIYTIPRGSYYTSKKLSKTNNEYEIINNLPKEKRKYEYESRFVIEENKERVIEGIIKDYGRYFLYSINDNPNWGMQEKIMQIGTRFHLG
jgi:hypothetical protein